MFKNISLYRIGANWAPSLQECEAALQPHAFVTCGASQEKSVGWVGPRGEAHGALIEATSGHWILKLMVEAKLVPGSVVKQEVEKRVERIEQETGRKPGRKERKEMTEDARADLMLRAFSAISSSLVWIDLGAHTLVIEASSQSRADEVVTMLVRALPDLSVSLVSTQSSPSASMAAWLTSQEPPVGFTADRDCSLKASDESKSSVRYAHHPLDTDEVRAHIAQGKIPTQLAMTWNDRVSFVLTNAGTLKKLEFLDAAVESDSSESGFDANVAIATGNLSKMISDLVEALGGEVKPVEELEPA